MRILIVGWGLIAQRHARNLRTLDPSIELAAWRQRPGREALRLELKADVFYGLEACQEWRPDAAIIANPAPMHMETALDLVAAGAHLFVEKPMSDDDWLTSTLPEDCARLRRVLMVGYDLRFYRPLQLVKEAIEQGRIGRPMSIRCEVGQYLPYWRPGRDYRTSVSARSTLGGGVLLELSHEIDYARWLMGEVASVSAMAGRLSDLEIDVEDTADVLLRFESGAQGSIHMDMTDRAWRRSCRVVGTEGSIQCDLLTGIAHCHKDDSEHGTGYLLHPVLEIDGLSDPIRVKRQEDALLEEMRHFLACCRGEATPPVDGREGRRVLEIALAAKRSATEGRVIEV